MLDKLKALLSSHADNTDEQQPGLQLASAAVLIELMFADFEDDESELEAIRHSLQQSFALPDHELSELIEEALQAKRDSVSDYPFVAVINNNCDAQQKIELIHMLWRVAYADGNLDKFEEHYIRKISDLLYVSHKEFIRAKLAVSAEQ